MASLSTNYVGRVSDVDIFGLSEGTTSEAAALSFNDGASVGGSYKEAQKFLRLLLSRRGTLAGQSDYGTNFYDKLTQGYILNEAQFRSYFAAAKARIINFLRTAKLVDGARDPRFLDDEIIQEVNLTALVVLQDKVTATFAFSFLNDEADILIPVAIPVGV